ncbi:hypothetical protein [Achromobacter insuavis]|uniref:hypothetical protein n=1 Tax=Achromobacter insuavis TaxID=1287735 RepID=UPI001F13D0F7|nr:hypothetical protein [Achromobacter insuavis]
MFFLPPTNLPGYLRRLHIAFWTALGCMAVSATTLYLLRESSERIGPLGLVILAGVGAFGYYLVLLNHIAYTLKKNNARWVLAALLLWPAGWVIGYAWIVSETRWYMATNVRGADA